MKQLENEFDAKVALKVKDLMETQQTAEAYALLSHTVSRATTWS